MNMTPNGLTALEASVLDGLFGRRTDEGLERTRDLIVDRGASGHGIGGYFMSIKSETYR